MRINPIALVALCTGFVIYGLAATTSFTSIQLGRARFDPLYVFAVTSLGGAVAILLGYASIIVIGGIASLEVARLSARIGRSKHIVSVKIRAPNESRLERLYLIYTSALVFLLLVFMSWDIYNADGSEAYLFQPLVHSLNVLARPVRVNVVMYSLNLIPILLVLVALAGIIPSLSLPYFHRFRITGVNSSPFHAGLLATLTGLVVGVGALLAIVGFFYKVLWTSRTPALYHFVLLVMAGISIHYALGTLLGRDKSERKIREKLTRLKESDGVFIGTVDVKISQKSE